MFISSKLFFMFRYRNNLLDYTPQSDQNGCAGVT